MTKIVNLTPHEINIIMGEVTRRSGSILSPSCGLLEGYKDRNENKYLELLIRYW